MHFPPSLNFTISLIGPYLLLKAPAGKRLYTRQCQDSLLNRHLPTVSKFQCQGEAFSMIVKTSRTFVCSSTGDTNMEEPSSICFTHFLLSSLIRIVRVSFRNFFAILYISLVSRNSITNPRSGEECEDRMDIGAKVWSLCLRWPGFSFIAPPLFTQSLFVELLFTLSLHFGYYL